MRAGTCDFSLFPHETEFRVFGQGKAMSGSMNNCSNEWQWGKHTVKQKALPQKPQKKPQPKSPQPCSLLLIRQAVTGYSPRALCMQVQEGNVFCFCFLNNPVFILLMKWYLSTFISHHWAMWHTVLTHRNCLTKLNDLEHTMRSKLSSDSLSLLRTSLAFITSQSST